jgi:hypothetical protein
MKVNQIRRNEYLSDLAVMPAQGSILAGFPGCDPQKWITEISGR